MVTWRKGLPEITFLGVFDAPFSRFWLILLEFLCQFGLISVKNGRFQRSIGRERDQMRRERDAALQQVAEMEQQVAELERLNDEILRGVPEAQTPPSRRVVPPHSVADSEPEPEPEGIDCAYVCTISFTTISVLFHFGPILSIFWSILLAFWSIYWSIWRIFCYGLGPLGFDIFGPAFGFDMQIGSVLTYY
jgi:hypothetical protein